MNGLSGLTVLSGILSDPLIAAFAAGSGERTHFLRLLFERRAECGLARYVSDAVLADENAFSRACSRAARFMSS